MMKINVKDTQAAIFCVKLREIDIGFSARIYFMLLLLINMHTILWRRHYLSWVVSINFPHIFKKIYRGLNSKGHMLKYVPILDES